MAKKNPNGYGGMKTPAVGGGMQGPFGFGGGRPQVQPGATDPMQPRSNGAVYAGPNAGTPALGGSLQTGGSPTGIGAPRAGLDTAFPASLMGMGGQGGAPMGGNTARDGMEATMEEYRMAQQGRPQAMDLFRLRNPDFTEPTAQGGLLASLQGMLQQQQQQQQQQQNGPPLQFDARGNLTPGQQIRAWTPPPGY